MEPEQKDQSFLEYDPNLDFWDQPRLLRGLLAVLGVSAVMIWVEVLFHRFILLPEGNAAVKNAIRCKHNELEKPIDEMTDAELEEKFGTDITFSTLLKLSGSLGTDKASLMGLYLLEQKKLDRANMYAYLSMFIPFSVVCYMMLRIYYKLKQDKYRHHVVQVFSGFAMEGVFLSVFFSVLFFLLFQIVFYAYGQDFDFATANELQFELMDYSRREMFQQFFPELILRLLGLKLDDIEGYMYDNPKLELVGLGPFSLVGGSGGINLSNIREQQFLYPKPIDKTSPFINPIEDTDLGLYRFENQVGDVFYTGVEIAGYEVTEPNEESRYDYRYTKRLDYEALKERGIPLVKQDILWQEKYQTQLCVKPDGFKCTDTGIKDYCDPAIWIQKYPTEFGSIYNGSYYEPYDSDKILSSKVNAWGKKEIALYESRTSGAWPAFNEHNN